MWRLRAIIETEVEVLPGEAEFPEGKLVIFEINDENSDSAAQVTPNSRFCDVSINDDTEDILEAFALLYDKINICLDRISIVSYGKVYLKTILSVTPCHVFPNEEFEIAIPQFMFNRKTKVLPLKNLELATVNNDYHMRLERLMRLGLNSSSEEEKYIHYFSLLEEIARSESEEYIEAECEKCKHKSNTGRKKTNNYIKEILRSHGIDNKLIKAASEIRNKIAHGGATKNKVFYSKVSSLNSHLEEVCLLEVEKRSEYSVLNRLNAHIIDIPVVTHMCVCNKDGSFDLVRSNPRVPVRFVKLQHGDDSVYEETRTSVGFPLGRDQRPIIDPFSWPEIIRE